MHIVSKDCFDFTIKYLTVLILLFCLSPSYSAEHIRYQLETASSEPVGDSAYFLKEPDQLLSFQQIQQAEFQEQFIQSNLQVLTLGVGSKPAWVKLPIKNNSTERVKRKLVVDAPWLDDVQVYIQHLETNQVEYYQTGDNHPFSSRPLETRTFHFDASIQPGDTDIYIRVATPDPMVIPIYLLKDTDADAMTLTFQYGYGFGYGFLIALLAYNFMLFIGLREFRYLLYVIYLGTFTAMNFTYTGHGFMWLWRENMLW